MRCIDLTRDKGIASQAVAHRAPLGPALYKGLLNRRLPEHAGGASALCYALGVQRETAFNVSAIKDTVLRSIKLNQQAYNNRDADVLREVYLEPMLSQVAHDLSGDFESFPAARLDITCEVLDVSYTAYLQIGKVELSAYGLEASPQNVNVTTKEEWIYRLVPDAEKGVGLGRRTTHRFLGYYHYTLVDIDGRWWITDVQSASEIWLP
jgi:hypothetical protein